MAVISNRIDTKLFFDPFAQGKFAQYYFTAHERNGGPYDEESARQQIEEAQLFIDGPDRTHEFIGSYETSFNEDDDNQRAWAVPNVVGIARRGDPRRH